VQLEAALLQARGDFKRLTAEASVVSTHLTLRASTSASESAVVCCGMGWLRLLGSLKFWVSLAEYSLLYKALLQKRPIILRSLLIAATP